MNFIGTALIRIFFILDLTRTSRKQEIFATKAQRHEGFFLLFSLSALVSLWRAEKRFATKSTKFTTKELLQANI